MKKNLLLFSILSILSAFACKNNSGNDFIGTWVGNVSDRGINKDTLRISCINQSDEYMLVEGYNLAEGHHYNYKFTGILQGSQLIFNRTSFSPGGSKVEFELIQANGHIIAKVDSDETFEFSKIK